MQPLFPKSQFSPWMLFLGIIFSLLPSSLFSQSYQLSNGKGDVVVTGTSSLHDWEVEAQQKSGTLNLDTSGETPAITALKFTVAAESLKSGKGTMDKNTYKALKTERHKNIVFEFLKVREVTPVISNSKRYKIIAEGNLTVAGQTRKIEQVFTLTLNENQARLAGIQPLKMTQYGIDPPTALLGTIKTGDQIEVHFDTLWTK